ncbi:type I restriction endonuclease [Cronobacter dublinensis]
MSWASKSLGEILEQSGRDRAGEQQLPVLSITMKHGLVDQAEKFKKRVASSDTSNYRIAYKNELVVGFPIDEGVLGFQTKYPAGIVSPAYNIWKLQSEADCHIPYLERYLRSTQARSIYASRMQGAVARRRTLTKTDFLNLEIPFPPLDDQIRIDHLLGKVEGLIALRKQHLQQLDDLLESMFLELFGDPVRNEKGWRKRQFSDLLDDIESGKSPKCETRQASIEEWGVLKLGAVTSCRFDENENKALPKGIAPSLRNEVRAGDLLFSRKNTYDLVAACAYVFKTRPKLLMPDLIFRFSFKQNADVNPIFMWRLLVNDSQRKAIQSLATGAAGSMPNISKGNLKAISLALPPLHLQNQFSTIVMKIEAIKSRYQQSLTDLECLFSALSQNAFNGELDLTRVPMPKPSTQDSIAVFQEDQASMSATVAPILPAIHLPNIGNLLAALENAESRKTLITEWLEAYRTQLADTAFSLQQFMELAQRRLAELNPDYDLVMGASDYEYIKTWVFEALAAGKLKQVFDDAGNRIELKAALEHSAT